jgi:hypothetical protein
VEPYSPQDNPLLLGTGERKKRTEQPTVEINGFLVSVLIIAVLPELLAKIWNIEKLRV